MQEVRKKVMRPIKQQKLWLVVLVLLTLVILSGCQKPKTGSQSKEKHSQSNKSILARDFKLNTPLFSANSPWNQRVGNVKVLPKSEQQILLLYRVLLGDTTDLKPADNGMEAPWPFMVINYDEFSIPIFRANSGKKEINMLDYEGKFSESNPKVKANNDKAIVAISFGKIRPSGPQDLESDGHAVLFNPKTFIEYDFWQATTIPGKGGGRVGVNIFDAGAIDIFSTKKLGVNTDTYSSARATGAPLLAGLIIPEDIENGSINHALAVAIPSLRNTSSNPFEPSSTDYFYPISTTETDYINTNPKSLAAGQRLRLKKKLVDDEGKPFNVSELAPITQMYLESLQNYGAYLVDNSGGFTFYAEDIHTANISLSDNELKELIGYSASKKLPANKTKWQTLMEQLDVDLEKIPLAYGIFEDGDNPAKTQVRTFNFEVVEPASR